MHGARKAGIGQALAVDQQIGRVQRRRAAGAFAV